jgi:hypothetical protein
MIRKIGGHCRVRHLSIRLACALSLGAVSLAIAAGGQVSGRLVGPDGGPLQGFTIQLIADETAIAESLPTDRQGRFRMTEVPAGTYSVELLTLDRRSCETSLPQAVVTEGGSAQIDLRLAEMPECSGFVPEGGTEAESAGAKPKRGRGWVPWASVAAGVTALLIVDDDDEGSSVSPATP